MERGTGSGDIAAGAAVRKGRLVASTAGEEWDDGAASAIKRRATPALVKPSTCGIENLEFGDLMKVARAALHDAEWPTIAVR